MSNPIEPRVAKVESSKYPSGLLKMTISRSPLLLPFGSPTCVFFLFDTQS